MAAANSLADDDGVSVVVSGVALVWSLAALSKSVGDTALIVGAVVGGGGVGVGMVGVGVVVLLLPFCSSSSSSSWSMTTAGSGDGRSTLTLTERFVFKTAGVPLARSKISFTWHVLAVNSSCSDSNSDTQEMRNLSFVSISVIKAMESLACSCPSKVLMNSGRNSTCTTMV